MKATLTLAILLIILATPASTETRRFTLSGHDGNGGNGGDNSGGSGWGNDSRPSRLEDYYRRRMHNVEWNEELHPRAAGRFGFATAHTPSRTNPGSAVQREESRKAMAALAKAPADPIGKIVSYTGVSTGFRDNIGAAYRSAPEILRNDAGPTATYLFNSPQQMSRVTGNDAPPIAAGFAVMDKGVCKLAFMESTTGQLSVIGIKQNLTHELLHCVDFNTSASSDKAFIDAFNKDVNAETIQQIANDHFAHYATPIEAFAEAGSRLVQPVEDAADTANFRKDFPNTTRYMAELLTKVGIPIRNIAPPIDPNATSTFAKNPSNVPLSSSAARPPGGALSNPAAAAAGVPGPNVFSSPGVGIPGAGQ